MAVWVVYLNVEINLDDCYISNKVERCGIVVSTLFVYSFTKCNPNPKKPCVLRPRASKLSVILQEESHTIGFLSIQLDKYETRLCTNN